ncbi:TonB-dependent receptor domain-containing protein [Aquidulcibacter sp.]|uniref:TonB-dependent receptor domain-containing protein n=1 Tax=Aquidulcibacter sp. TaxID=2052990 RepID=UPI003BA56F8F
MKSSTRATLFGATALTVISILPTVAAAQNAPATPEAKAESEETSTPVETIVVVGSRIRKDTFNSASPIQIITRDDTVLAGLTSTAAVLQSNSVTSGSAQVNDAFGGFVTNGGPGAATVGLRGLGPGRTLVMINGRRVAPAGSRGSVGSADLNVLPSALISRTEVLRDGASAIYGSDAIGGVINIVTRKFKGLTIEGQHNQPTEGGGERSRISLAGGTAIGNLNIQGSLEYYQSQPQTYNDRDWTRCQTEYQFNKATGATIDYLDPLTGKSKCWGILNQGASGGVTINTLGTPNFAGVAAPGAGTSGVYNRWRPNSSIATGLAGFEGVSGASLNVRDTFDPDMLNNTLLSPVKTTTAFATATYDAAEYGNMQLYGEFLFNRRESSQTGYRQLVLDYPTGSPLIPANIAAVPGNFLSLGGSTLLPNVTHKARAFIGYGNTESWQEVDFMKILGGVKGDIPWFKGWNYDLNVQFSKSDATYVFQSWLTDRTAETLLVAPAAAGVPANLIRNGLTCTVNNLNPAAAKCVPAPALNSNTLAGNLPDDWKNYTLVDVPSTTTYEETVFSAGVSGPAFKLPAGSIDVALGVEYRKASINDQPSTESINGNLYNLSSAVATVGSDSVIEVFGEVEVPLLANAFLAKALNIELAGRYTDYDSYGENSTYKAGIFYKPFDFLTLRASTGTSYRAPALFEQFLGTTSSFSASSGDICNLWNAPGRDPNVAKNCSSFGLPPGWDVGNGNNQSIRVNASGGAGFALGPETSDNLTGGIVFSPSFLPDVLGDFSFAVDYFDIDIQDGVAQPGVQFILNQCYSAPNFNSPLCIFTTRDPVTKALTVNNNYTNISSVQTKGYDYTLRWSKDFGQTRMVVNAAVTQFTGQITKARPDAPSLDFNGTLNAPEYTGDININLTHGPWRFRWGVDWTAAQESYTYYGLNKSTTPFILDVPDYYLHNASIRYTAKKWGATLGVRNISDETPPQISSTALYNRIANVPLYSGYDYRGREVFLNLTASF